MFIFSGVICVARGRKRDTEKRTRCFELYKKLGNLTLVAKETGVDRSQLGRWAKEENWDRHLAIVQDEVGRKLRLGALEEQVGLDVTTDELIDNIKRFRVLALKALQDFVDNEIEFTKPQEVLKALAMYDDRLRLHLGEPTARVASDRSIVLYGLPENSKLAITTMLQIAKTSPFYAESVDVIDVTPEADVPPVDEV